jgi:uncharacterized RDD family membrane protein YckC
MDAPQQPPESQHAAPEQLEYGGFWLRVFASLIDTVLFGLLLLPILTLTVGDVQWSTVEGDGMSASTLSLETLHIPGGLNLLINYVLPAVVVLLFWLYKSATPGKLMLNLVIVDARTGEKPTTAQWLIRYLGYYISGFFIMLGFIWVGLDKKKQGWHDKLAGTVVLHKKRQAPVKFTG